MKTNNSEFPTTRVSVCPKDKKRTDTLNDILIQYYIFGEQENTKLLLTQIKLHQINQYMLR